ncbi:ankyrin repeat RF_0381 [Olea europaea subsp. europaea]|uniref:Ankyrin repeat RF_0381 n=2 Tax=Olea europaea subsp. europaea TaxID=158383 RepID=A0A8S0SI41_OLEEU|nr:ankyrin repeat RF_0381 [Olea europaea subsp. europaea]
MPPTYFPLRWESIGDQWWFASPIDWAAANGHYDLVRELLHLDTNLLIKLSSLRRIRRLESVWDNEEQFNDVAKCRSQVAQKLLQECETKKGHNSLIRAGYGGWLLYTAASAGDVIFVKELLDKDPLLVFGEGEYGVTDIFYAAARSKNSEVFRLVFDHAILRTYSRTTKGENEEVSSAFKSEMVNRAVHAAARGGNMEILREFCKDESDVLAYRDAQGSIVLHTASGIGQVEVVKNLLSSFDIINTTDNQGNTALIVAAYRGHVDVVKILICTSPSCASLTNNYGDTFLHMAVAGFRTPGFRRLDQQIELMKQLVGGKIVNIEDIVNVKNNDGRTALHTAVIENIQSDIVELLMSVHYVNLNIRDADGNTPLDLLKKRPKSASSEILIKRLISAGGISNCQDQMTRSVLASHLRMQGIGGSPGTSFRIPDTEIYLYSGIGNASDVSCELTSEYASCSGELNRFDSPAMSSSTNKKKFDSVNNAAGRLKILLRWSGKKERKEEITEMEDNNSVESFRTCSSFKNSPIPLRQKFSRKSSPPNNKRVLATRSSLPSPSTKERFAAELSHGVVKMMPHSYFGSPSTPFSESSWSSAVSADKEKGVDLDSAGAGPSSLNQSPKIRESKTKHRHSSFNTRLMNHYFCFGSQGLAVDNQNHKRLAV